MMVGNRRTCWMLVSLLVALVALVAPAPLRAQSRSCPDDAPVTDPNVATLLDGVAPDGTIGLTTKINTNWSGAATSSTPTVDPLKFGTGDVTHSCPAGPPDPGAICFEQTGLTNCLHATVNINVSQLTGLKDLKFSTMIPGSPFNAKDPAEHAVAGPDAGKITDGSFAPGGTDWNDPHYTVVLPLDGEGHALTIDLGASITVCGYDSQCGPVVQADRHAFQFEYLDGVSGSWVAFGQFAAVSGSGLLTRGLSPIKGVPAAPTFTAQYVRVWALPGADDSNFSVSELQLKNIAGAVISIGKPAVGPRTFQIMDGKFAPEETTWNDKTYAVVLRKEGPGHALVVDLGGPVKICGNGDECRAGPTIQADKNEFQLDYSLDAVNWIPYSQLPAVSSSGLRTRGLKAITEGQHNPSFTARYVRVWAVSGDGNYSVSEIQLYNTSSALLTAALTYGPEGLATNGEFAPEGADWDDHRYAAILSPCTTSQSSVCPKPSGLTGALVVDLTASFPVSQLVVQADRHRFQIDSSQDGASWTPLWTVSEVSGSGLLTRTSPVFSPALQAGRYLRIYGVAGSDNNYSVSALQVVTAKANTVCASYSGANAGQDFSCTYDGQFSTGLDVGAGLPISFTIDSMPGYLRCTNGTVDGSTSTEDQVPPGTQCTGILTIASAWPAVNGEFCSGSCASGNPASVLTHAELDPDGFDSGSSPVVFELKPENMFCNNDFKSTDAKHGMATAVQSAAAQATRALFNGLAGHLVPSAKCEPALAAPPSNTELRGHATQVGRNHADGHVHVTGHFAQPDPVALHEHTLTLGEILNESGGVGELVRNDAGAPVTPITLAPRKGSTADRATYATAPGASPAIRVELARDKTGDLVKFTIDVERATMPTRPTCSGNPSPTAQLATSFALDRTDPLSSAHAVQDWQCKGTQLWTP